LFGLGLSLVDTVRAFILVRRSITDSVYEAGTLAGPPDTDTWRLYDRTSAQASTAGWSSIGYGVTTRFNFGTAAQRPYGAGCAGAAGTPGIAIGHNEHVIWSPTSAYADVASN